MHFVVQWIKQDLDKCVRVVAVHFVFALDPRLFIFELVAPLWNIIKVLWGSTEVLHSVRIVAV